MKKEDGIQIARNLKKNLKKKGYPIQHVFLFGSVARDEAKEASDIDIAILCLPFLKNRHEENVEFLLEGANIDTRIETICLHPEDMDKEHWGVAQDLKKEGIPV